VELNETMQKRHMTRNFSGQPPGPGVVDRLLEGALRAPSAGNTQGREFVVLEGADQTSRYWEATTDAQWRRRSPRFEGLSRAPVIVLAFADPDAYLARYREEDKAAPDGSETRWVIPFWFVDTAFAVMALLLGATDQGVGASFLGNFRGEAQLRSAIGAPGRLRWLGAVLLGEAAAPDPPSSSAARPRRGLEDSVHRGGW
jgi:nitroreductase